MHPEAYAYVARQVKKHKLNDPAFTVVELGSFDVNGSVRGFFDEVACYVGLDVREGPGVDIVDDAAYWQPDDAVDVVVSTSALEHMSNPEAALSNALDMLAPGGWLVLTTVTPPWGAHSNDGGALQPGDTYSLFWPADIERWLAGFDGVSIETTPQGDVFACAQKPAKGGAK